MEGERLRLEDEGWVVKKVKDPKLLTQLQVDKHYVMGHIPYKDCCPACVEAHGEGNGTYEGCT